MEVTDGVPGQGQTDDGNDGADDYGRHQLGDPLDTGKFDDHGDDNVDKTGHGRAENQAKISGLRGNGTCKRGAHRPNEGKGGAEEHGTLEAGEELVDQGTYAGTEEGGGGAHEGSALGHGAACVDDDGNHQRGRHDSQELLNGEDDDLSEFWLVLDAVDEFHA